MSNSDYLRDLAQRLRHIAVIHGVDGGDVDRLEEISREVEQLTKERDAALYSLKSVKVTHRGAIDFMWDKLSDVQRTVDDFRNVLKIRKESSGVGEEDVSLLSSARRWAMRVTGERNELAKAFIEVFDSTTSHRQATLYALREKLRKEASGE